MKRLFSAAATIILLLGGCGVINNNSEPGRYIPVPTIQQGEIENTSRVEKFAIYFYNSASKTLTAEVRSIEIGQDKNPAEVALVELLKGPSNDKLLSKVAPEGMEFEHIEFSRNVANVYLLYNGDMQAEEEFILEAAIANTVTDILGARYVSVFYNGIRKGYAGIPRGLMVKQMDNLDEAWAQLTAKYKDIPPVLREELEVPEPSESPGASASPEVSATPVAPKEYICETVLYFISADGGYILPEVRDVSYTDGNYLPKLIAELVKGPQNTAFMTSPLADGLELANEPILTALDEGGYELNLDFNMLPAKYDYSDTNDQLLSYASMIYTITGFIPQIESVKMYVNGNIIANENMKRDDYLGYIGSSVPLYFADKNSGLLIETPRSMEQGNVWSAKARLTELLKGPLSGDGEDVLPVKITGIEEKDIKSVELSGDMAYIDISAHFKEACSGISEKSEMMLVYAIVNTVTAIDGINRVQFLIEGEQADTLAGSICLSNPFLRNYGIIKTGG